MAFDMFADIRNQATVVRRLKAMPAKLQHKVIKGTMINLGRQVVKIAKTLAPRESGLLRLSIRSKTKVFTRRGIIRTLSLASGAVAQRVAVYRDKNRKGAEIGLKRAHRVTKRTKVAEGATWEYRNPAKYSHLQEYGTKDHAAKPFMRPALQAAGNSATGKIAAAIRSGMKRALA